MHAAEREKLILQLVQERGFISFQELDRQIDASQATLRRDLDKLSGEGRIVRVRGGAQRAGETASSEPSAGHLSGVPFHENISKRRAEKQAIGRAAAALCLPGESVIIDGGSTTLQMCSHIESLGLQVLTNSLHVVSALLSQADTRIYVPAGAVFREQNIVLSPFEDDGMSNYRASKMFIGAATIGRHGLMQTDVILVQAERRLLKRAEEIIVLADSSKFHEPAGHIVCELSEIDVIITDDKISDASVKLIKAAGVKLIVVPTEA